MQESGFWDNIKKAEEVTKKSKSIKDKIESFDKLKSQIEDIEVLKEIMEDDDEESANNTNVKRYTSTD
jgi:peptide chain release factor 2